jgi:membrane dipeptidase
MDATFVSLATFGNLSPMNSTNQLATAVVAVMSAFGFAWQTALAAGDGAMPETSQHQQLLTLDSHLDTPIRLGLPGFDITERHSAQDDYSQIDLPRMREGGLDGGFWAVFSYQGELDQAGYAQSYENAQRRLATIKAMVARHPKHFALALRAEDAQPIAAAGKRVVYLSLENAYPLGDDISRLEHFYAEGVRMLGLVHTKNNQFADSSTDKSGPKWQGLSPAGKALVREANRLGMLIDASHAHDLALAQMMEISSTPVILSHSGCKAVFEHPRNVDDSLLKNLADHEGVMQVNTLGSYLKKLPTPDGRLAALGEFVKAWHDSEDQVAVMPFATFRTRRQQIDQAYPPGKATFDDYMAHLLHALEIMGPSKVGIGADWDGGGGVTGMEDVTMIPQITERLAAAGYTLEELQQVWSGNLLRVLANVETAAEKNRLTLAKPPLAP